MAIAKARRLWESLVSDERRVSNNGVEWLPCPLFTPGKEIGDSTQSACFPPSLSKPLPSFLSFFFNNFDACHSLSSLGTRRP